MFNNNIDLTRSVKETIRKIGNLTKEYNKIPKDYAIKKAKIVKEREESLKLSEEEKKQNMDIICDELEEKISHIEQDDSLSEEEKEEKMVPLYDELDSQIAIIEDYSMMNSEEREKALEEEFEKLEQKMVREKVNKKKQMILEVKKRANFLKYMITRDYPLKEIYEAHKMMMNLEIEDKSLEKELRDAYLEEVMSQRIEEKLNFKKNNYKTLSQIDIAYSSLNDNDFNKETVNNNIKTGFTIIDHINDLLKLSKDNKDRGALNEACKLINSLPNDDIDKNDLQAQAAEVNSFLNSSYDDIDSVSDINQEEQNESIDNPIMPTIKGNKPALTWKTAVSVALGVGVGATVFFTTGPTGVIVMGLAGGLAKRFINKKRQELMQKPAMEQLESDTIVEKVEEPTPGLKGKIEKFKKYLTSEEGLRDMSWMVNSAIITGSALSIASAIHGAVSAANTPTSTTTSVTATPKATANVQTNIPPSHKTINIDKVYDTASWAKSGVHAENPLKYISASDGSVVTKIQNGAALIEKGGVAQGWIPADGVKVGDLVNAAVKVGSKIK